MALLGLALAASGCGTNLPRLMAEDSRLVMQADQAVSTAEELGTGLEQPVYAAEATKDESCRFIHEAVMDRLERDPDFGEAFVTDLSTVVALVVPVAAVERCADALVAYRDSVERLQRRLVALGAMPAGTGIAQSNE